MIKPFDQKLREYKARQERKKLLKEAPRPRKPRKKPGPQKRRVFYGLRLSPERARVLLENLNKILPTQYAYIRRSAEFVHLNHIRSCLRANIARYKSITKGRTDAQGRQY